MKKSPVYLSAASLLALMVWYAPFASGIELKPGKWGVTTTNVSPMSSQPVEQYIENCVAETSFNPIEEMMDQGMSSMCEVTVNSDSANNLDADLTCNMQGAGTMNGKLEFTVAGESASGAMDMSMSFNGQTMSMTSKWEASYLGACD